MKIIRISKHGVHGEHEPYELLPHYFLVVRVGSYWFVVNILSFSLYFVRFGEV
jgi:hypothetical protein